MGSFTTFLDASVLYPAPLRDLLLEVAVSDLYRAKWSNPAHEEWINALLQTRTDLTREKLERTRDMMNAHVHDALVTNFEDLLGILTLPDPNDRHVLAAAIKGRADLIVTANLKDFPDSVLGRWGVEAQHPDEFLTNQFHLSQPVFLKTVRTVRLRLKNPPKYSEGISRHVARPGAASHGKRDRAVRSIYLTEYPMASTTILNAKNLEALGAEHLAKLLIEISTGNAAAKRRLRMELAPAQSPADLAREVRKRLTTIARSRSFVDWQGVRSLANDLDTQRRAIVETVAKADPKEALDLLWRFMGLARPVFERCDDGSGTVIGTFHETCHDIGDLARKAQADPEILADQAFDALVANDYGQFDDLISVLAPALGRKGLEHLKQRMLDLSNTPVGRPDEKDRVKIGWSSSGPIYADEMEERSRISTVRLALQEIADAQGDADAFIAQYDEDTRKVPKIAAKIARRLLKAGRAEEALTTIDAAEHRKHGGWEWPDFDWEDARIDVLEALGRTDDAQKGRWDCFERSLSSVHLRAYLKKLPDFDDVEAEEKALDHAQGFRSRLGALSFLVSWPALDRAAKLVLEHADDLDGDHYEILTPAANALAAKHPLAATLVLRAMIDFSLNRARSSRYKHAARHLLECSSLSSAIEDFGRFETHDAYEARLRREHSRKSSFWSLVG